MHNACYTLINDSCYSKMKKVERLHTQIIKNFKFQDCIAITRSNKYSVKRVLLKLIVNNICRYQEHAQVANVFHLTSNNII